MVCISIPYRNGEGYFSLLHLVQDRFWCPFSLVTIGYLGFFLVGKGAGLENDHSPSSSAEVKNAWRGI